MTDRFVIHIGTKEGPFQCFLPGRGRRMSWFMKTLIATKFNLCRELQSAGGEELSALMPSVLDRAFKGEL